MSEKPKRTTQNHYLRWMIAIVVVIVVIGTGAVVIDALVTTHKTGACTKVFNNWQGIRTQVWSTRGSYEMHYASTLDGGETWTEMLVVPYDSSAPADDCGKVPTADEMLFYVRAGNRLLIVDDSGSRIIDASSLAGQRSGICRFEDVTFQNRHKGTLSIACYPDTRTLHFTFNTADGGATWQNVSE